MSDLGAMDVETSAPAVSAASILANMRDDPLMANLQEIVRENELVLPLLLSSLESNPVVSEVLKHDREGFIALLKAKPTAPVNASVTNQE